jgi:hypothetical protein
MEKGYNNKYESKLSIPVDVFKDGEYFVITTNEVSEAILGAIVVQGKTFEEAEEQFWSLARFMKEYDEERSRELDKWKFFQKGDWKHIGGTWFTLMGINVYFRKGKGMKGGRYIPFTKLNISVHNHWRRKKEKWN